MDLKEAREVLAEWTSTLSSTAYLRKEALRAALAECDRLMASCKLMGDVINNIFDIKP